MRQESDKTYEEGLLEGRREGRLKSLEIIVSAHTSDLDKLKPALYALYGAIALVNFLPELKGLFGGG